MVILIDKLCDLLEKITFIAIVILLTAMLSVAWAHVFCRYVLGSALFWSEEMLRFSLVWFALLSASLIFRRKKHLGIILLVEKFPINLQNVISTAIIYIFLVINIVVTIQGIELLGRVHAQLTPALRIPVSLPYASVPVSFLLMTIYSISDVFHQFAKKEKAS
jgi:TRAP-type C4-dicarboxylate transport system permease small subunit